MPESRALRLGRWSRRFSPSPWRNALSTLLLCSLAGIGALMLGAIPLSPPAFLHALVQPDSHAGLIVLQLRAPRVLLALLCGGALAVSGWLFQQVMRNALASPDTLGVTAGASAAAVVAPFAFCFGRYAATRFGSMLRYAPSPSGGGSGGGTARRQNPPSRRPPTTFQ